MPLVSQQGNQLIWEPVKNATHYQIVRNGKTIETTATTFHTINPGEYATYQVIATDNKGTGSFASEPLIIISPNKQFNIQVEKFIPAAYFPYAGFNGSGFVEISKTRNRMISIPLTVEQEGLYYLQTRYANGNGPVNTNSRCALRNLYVNNSFSGVLIFPQRGKDEWSNWGYSNMLSVQLSKGHNILAIVFEDNNGNMDGEINQAMLDEVVIYR